MTYDYRGIADPRPDDLAAMVMADPDWGRLDIPAAVEKPLWDEIHDWLVAPAA